MPLFHGDLKTPGTVKKLTTRLKGFDGIVVISPEYNGCLPPLLKNTIDWTSTVSTDYVKSAVWGLASAKKEKLYKNLPRPKLTRAQISDIYRHLQTLDPAPRTELDYTNVYTLVVAVALSAQSTDLIIAMTSLSFRAWGAKQQMSF